MAITTNGGAGVTADAVATLSNKTLEAPVINNATFTGAQAGLALKFDNTIVFEGTTDDAYELTLSAGDPTADRTITLPDETGTLATKTYVDNIASGIIAKPAVLGATTANVSGTYNNGTAGVGATLTAASNGAFPSSSGGATGWAVGKGILLKNQTNKEENGRYFVSDMGSVSTPYVLTRCSYCDEASEIPGAYIFVQAGTYAGTAWIQIVADPATFVVGTDDIDVFQFAGTTGYVTTDGVETLTNKTLTTPVISTISNTGTVTLPTATDTLVGRDTTDTLTNKTLTSPVVNTAILKSPEERLTVSATAATGTVNYDALTQGVLYYTTDASGNWTLNVRGDGSNTLNSVLTTGDSITIVFLVTQGSTAYYSNAFTIDGTSVTPKYITGTAFSAGNASSIDSYVYTIIKTGSDTYTVLASQTKFA